MLMKKFFGILLVGLGMIAYPTVSAGNVNHEVIVATQIRHDNNIRKQIESETVCITKSGKCYHEKDCQCLRKSCVPVNVSDAINNNYSPCKICNK